VDQYILKNSTIISLYKDNLNSEQLNKMLIIKQKWKFIGYSLIPVRYLLIICFVLLCLKIGIFFENIKIDNSLIIRALILSEFVFVVQKVIHVIYLTKFGVTDIFDVQYFVPFSILIFYKNSLLTYGVKYVLSSLNLFELGFWIILAFFLRKLLNMNFFKSFLFVSKTYGLGILLWFIVILFLDTII